MSGGVGGVMPVALSLAMLAAFALAGGGIWLIARRGERKQGLLMFGVAVVLVLNVLIWAVPVATPAVH